MSQFAGGVSGGLIDAGRVVELPKLFPDDVTNRTCLKGLVFCQGK